MLTAFYMTPTWCMRDEYVDSDLTYESFGLEALDAPSRIASGSHYSYRYYSIPDRFTPMPSAIDRVAY